MSRLLRRASVWVVAAVLLLPAGGAWALNITYGGVVVQNLSSDGFTSTNSFLSFDGGTNDELYQISSHLDLDLYGTYANDIATGSTSQIVVSDAAYPAAQPFVWYASGGSATHYAIGAWPTVENTPNGMTSTQSLSDPTGTFGPGDFTGAFQYDFSLAPGASLTLPNPVPKPVLPSLLFLGACALALLASRKAA